MLSAGLPGGGQPPIAEAKGRAHDHGQGDAEKRYKPRNPRASLSVLRYRRSFLHLGRRCVAGYDIGVVAFRFRGADSCLV